MVAAAAFLERIAFFATFDVMIVMPRPKTKVFCMYTQLTQDITLESVKVYIWAWAA